MNCLVNKYPWNELSWIELLVTKLRDVINILGYPGMKRQYRFLNVEMVYHHVKKLYMGLVVLG